MKEGSIMANSGHFDIEIDVAGLEKIAKAKKRIRPYLDEYILNGKKVYLVEGVFDSIFLPNSIPMLGKYLSDLLFNRIYDKSESVTIILDGDAWDDTERLYHRLNCGKLMGRVSVVKLPKDKDIADLQGNLIDFPEFKLD
jgi:DNA primase